MNGSAQPFLIYVLPFGERLWIDKHCFLTVTQPFLYRATTGRSLVFGDAAVTFVGDNIPCLKPKDAFPLPPIRESLELANGSEFMSLTLRKKIYR